MIKLLITGTCGSGKSSAYNLFKNKLSSLSNTNNFQFFNTDELVNNLYENDIFKSEVEVFFGTSAKKEISKIVFGKDLDKLKVLNNIVSKYLDQYLIKWANSSENMVIEFPYFFEMLLESENSIAKLVREKFTVVTITMSNEYERLDRIKARSKITHPDWTDETIENIIKSQLDSFSKEALSDYIIFNDSDEVALEKKISRLLEKTAYSSSMSLCQKDAINLSFLNQSEDVFDKNLLRIISYAYNNSERKYHNLTHINNMLKWLGESGSKFKHNTELILAILFHDFIYDPLGKKNEIKSVEKMYHFVNKLKLNFKENVLLKAEKLILSTISHSINYNDDLCKEKDFLEMNKLFLDLDLLVLGQGRFAADRFEDQIRSEYRMHSDEIYNSGRKAVLLKFVNREKIYLSDNFKSYEMSAKESLNYLIKKLN